MLRERPNIFGQIKTSTLGFNLGFESTPLGQQEWTVGLGTTKMRREDCRNYLVKVASLPTRLQERYLVRHDPKRHATAQ